MPFFGPVIPLTIQSIAEFPVEGDFKKMTNSQGVQNFLPSR